VGEQTGQSHSALRIVAACQSSAEFVAAYARYCEGRSLFIATKSPKQVGQIVKFKIVLASGEHLMTGVGPVVENFAGRDNRFNRPGMRVEVEKLDASGRHWMEQLRARTSATPTPAVVSMPTGMFSIVSDDSIATAQSPAPAARPAPVVAAPADPVLPNKPPAAVPVAVNDHLSAGWEMDGLPPALGLPAPRAATEPLAARNGEGAKKSGKKSDRNGERPAAEKNGESRADAAQQAVVASGELEVPPLPPPPAGPGKGRSKRITFPALMFNKPRGLAVPAPTGALVPKPIALLPAASPREPGKLRPPTAPIEREPAAPVAPLGTPSDTEPHVMVPPVLEASIARPLEGAEGTPPPPAPPPAQDEMHPELVDAPPESDDVLTSAPERPRRSKASTTTPPPIWAERTVTQTLAAMVGGKPDPKVREETVHWTNPGFAALQRPEPPQVDIVEEDVPAAAPTSVPVVVGVELSSGMDRTVVSPPPVEMMPRRWRFVGALAVTAVVGIGLGYLIGVRQGGSLEKMPVDSAAAAPVANDRQALLAECSELAKSTAAPADATDTIGEQAATPAPSPASRHRPAAAARGRARRRRRRRSPAT